MPRGCPEGPPCPAQAHLQHAGLQLVVPQHAVALRHLVAQSPGRLGPGAGGYRPTAAASIAAAAATAAPTAAGVDILECLLEGGLHPAVATDIGVLVCIRARAGKLRLRLCARRRCCRPPPCLPPPGCTPAAAAATWLPDAGGAHDTLLQGAGRAAGASLGWANRRRRERLSCLVCAQTVTLLAEHRDISIGQLKVTSAASLHWRAGPQHAPQAAPVRREYGPSAASLPFPAPA